MKKILVVDDSNILRRIITFNLKAAGYEVLEAVNGKEGLETVENENPDMIFLDIMMPVMDGFTVLKELKSKEYSKPVVVLTAKGGESDEETAISLGAKRVLTKPFSPKLLVDTVKEMLGDNDG
ncbi:MAG: response regulator transcription factor [Thermotogota bacterium]